MSQPGRIVLAAALASALAAGIFWRVTPRPHVLTLVVCDVGQGDAILLRTPGGVDILVDGGRPDAKVLSCLGRHLAPWNRTIELVVLTHSHADHVGGLPAVARRYAIGRAISSGVDSDSLVYRAWIEALRQGRVPEQVVGAGDSLDLGSDVAAQVVGPVATSTSMDPNEASVVLRVVFGESTLLLTGDAGLESEQRMLASGQNLSAQILKVDHHGSRYSSGVDFLAAVDPRIALVSVAAKNSYGHPSAEALARLQATGAQIFRTDHLGDLVWISDGVTWRRVDFRGPVP